MPKFEEEPLDVEIPETDLEMTTTRAGGKGWQNVKKVETVVRIVPEGIAIRVRSLRLLKPKILVHSFGTKSHGLGSVGLFAVIL